MHNKTARLRWAFSALLVFILLAVLFAGALAIDRPAAFADPNLEMAVRSLLDNFSKPIYRSELLSIIELDLSGQKISDLSGMDQFRHLEALNLENNFIQDLSPLKTLNHLNRLNLSNNGITDLAAVQLGALTHLHLTELHLNATEILASQGRRNSLADITLLAEFQELEVLSLYGNRVSDLSPLSGLAKLRDLDLGENRVEDLSPLSGLTRLASLDLRWNSVADLAPLSGLKNLTALNLRANELSEIAPLGSLQQLTYLNLHSNEKIVSVAPLAELTMLAELIIENVPVGGQVRVLAGLTQLTRLNLANCQVSDFSVLAELMAAGALQDDPQTGSSAVLSIRDNLLEPHGEDPLQALRPYWANIATRDPFVLPTMPGLVAAPHFSQDGGYFTRALTLTLEAGQPHLEIYYTLDGSDPVPEHAASPPGPYQVTYRYTGPITIASRAQEENVYAALRTTHVENKIPWNAPAGRVFKGQTVRAIAYDPAQDRPSTIITQTYFVDENIYQRYPDLPVIALSADYSVLFQSDTGILNTGQDGDPFAHLETRVPANIEWIEPDGSTGFNGLYEIKLHGFTSVANPQKGLHVYAEPWLGHASIDYPVFQQERVNRLILRAWGTALEWDVFFSDAYHQSLVAQSGLDIQAYRPAILFINGEYWGLYEVREANKNLEYFAGHYNAEPLDLDILELGTADFIQEGDPEGWKDLLAFAAAHDLQSPANYAYIESQIDVDNFILYMIHCIFTGKKDWPGHNEAVWRGPASGGRWRWIQFDMDQGLRYGVDNFYDMVAHVLEDGAIPHPLFNALLENDGFKLKFLQAFAHHMNTTFRTSVEAAHFSQMAGELAPYVPEYLARWEYAMDWAEMQTQALAVIQDRAVLRKNQVLKNFHLSGTRQVHILADSAMGSVAINGFTLGAGTPGVADPGDWTGVYFTDIPTTFRADPKPGYRFVRWESAPGMPAVGQEFSLRLEEDLTLTALFEPIQ